MLELKYGKNGIMFGEWIEKAIFLLVLDNIDEMLDDAVTKEVSTRAGYFSNAKVLFRVESGLL